MEIKIYTSAYVRSQVTYNLNEEDTILVKAAVEEEEIHDAESLYFFLEDNIDSGESIEHDADGYEFKMDRKTSKLIFNDFELIKQSINA
jgi:hypothetical protein